MPYEIHVDRSRRLLRVSFTGLPDDVTLEAYERDIKRHITDFTSDGGSFDFLFDLRDTKVVEKQNLPQLQARNRWYVEHGLRRSASIVTSALLAMQTRRFAVDDRFKQFTSEEEAMAWLRSDEAGEQPLGRL